MVLTEGDKRRGVREEGRAEADTLWAPESPTHSTEGLTKLLTYNRPARIHQASPRQASTPGISHPYLLTWGPVGHAEWQGCEPVMAVVLALGSQVVEQGAFPRAETDGV